MTAPLFPKQLCFGTWNVITLSIPGASYIVAEELNKCNMDIVALQKTQWPQSGKINTKEYLIYYSDCEDNRYYGGVCFVANKRFSEAVVLFEAINVHY